MHLAYKARVPCEIVSKRETSDKGTFALLHRLCYNLFQTCRQPFLEIESNEETMSITKAASHRESTGVLSCTRCGTSLLPQATFCSSCGERLDKKDALSSFLQDEQEITNRYRITTLVCRRPNVNLYFALDNQQSRHGQQRMVAIRDIDINSLRDEARVQAIKLAQQEYDLLRLWRLPHVMPVVDMRYYHGHVYIVSAYPQTTASQGTTGNTGRLYTLHDFLQSGQGLPTEQQALTWIGQLCQALVGLHRHHILTGELDPYTILLNENSGDAECALMISWLSPQLQKLMPPSHTLTTAKSNFSAPEALQGLGEPRSDIYSLGAVFYLLLTGSLPDEASQRTRGRSRSPRELNGRVSARINDFVIQAISIEPAKRFQTALEMSEALFNPRYSRFQTLKLDRRDQEVTHSPAAEDGETIRIVPLSQMHVDRWRASRPQTATPGTIPHRPLTPGPTPELQEAEAIRAEWQQQPVAPFQSSPVSATPTIDAEIETQLIAPEKQVDKNETSGNRQTPLQDVPTSPLPQPSQNPTMSTWKQRITDIAPAISLEWLKKSPSGQESVSEQSPVETIDAHSENEVANSRIKHIQRLAPAKQQGASMAAAFIESPVCVQPNQVFTLRIHILGRDEPKLPPGTQQEEGRLTWLSSLARGDTLSIEVRVVLNQRHTYKVQKASVTIPAAGYVAEVTIPIQPLTSVPSGRRDRLHISFFDQQRHPLYDKPFMAEVFVSQLVKRGHEGHRVLTIPQ
jgi:serine/threonine protein kinase